MTTKQKLPPGLKKHAMAWRKANREYIDRLIREKRDRGLCNYARECATDFIESKAKASKVEATPEASSRAAHPCDPLRVAVAAQQAIVEAAVAAEAAAMANRILEEITLMILQMWLQQCESENP